MAIGNLQTEADLESFIRRVIDKTRQAPAVAPGFTVFPEAAAADVPVRGVFCDKADGVLKFKDAAGTLHALY